MIAAHPKQHRQLGDDGLFLLWRDAPSGGREGLLCMVAVCTDASCPCREVQLRAVHVDESLVSAEVGERGLALKRTKAVERERRVQALIDIDTGEVKTSEDGDEALLAWLPGELDGELLHHLARIRQERRGLLRQSDSWKQQSWAGWKPGEMLRWAEVFDQGRNDAYRINGELYFAEDLYCVTPGCTCTEMRILFGKKQPDESVIELGSVVVDTRSGDELRIGAPEGQHAQVEALWAGFRARHPARSFVASRAAMMKRVGQELSGLSQRSMASNPGNTGRNDPCPCGSGKKFKRCCA